MARTIVLGPGEISSAVADNNFFRLLPEFAVLRVKLETMRANSKKGCTPCRKRREVASVNADFMSIVPTLSDDGKARLKKYYGADGIRYTTIDRRTMRATSVLI